MKGKTSVLHCEGRGGGQASAKGALGLPEVVNCFPHSRHLRGPSAMWIFKWAFRFPTCTQTGAQKGSPWNLASPQPREQRNNGLPGFPRGRAQFLIEAQVPALKGKAATARRGTVLGETMAIVCCPWGAHLVELFVAVRTLVLLVGVVSLQVAHLGGGVREGAATVVTLVGFLATVYQLVALEVA